MLFIDDLSTEFLRHVSFEFPENSLNVLLGPSGSGKTTLLRYIAGICKDKTRSIRWAKDVDAVRFIASNLPEELMKLTLREFLKLHGCSDPVAWSQQFKIESRLLDVRQDSGRLSTGELRLISLAIGLVNLPKNSVLLIDELTNGLSGIHIRNVLENICRIQKDTESLVICAMHQPSSDTLQYFHNVYILSDRNKIRLTPNEALMFGGYHRDTESNLMALFSDEPLCSSVYLDTNLEASNISESNLSHIISENEQPLFTTEPVGPYLTRDLKKVRKKRLPLLDAIRLHTILKVRAPGLLTVAFIGAIIMAGFNLFINYNNHYVSPIVPSNPILNSTSLNLSQDNQSDETSSWSQGFSRFNGDIKNDKLTEEFVKKISYSFLSSILFGLPVYDRETADLTDESVIQPALAFVSELDSNRLTNILSLVTELYDAISCTADKISKNSTDVAPLYNSYVDVFHPDALEFVIILHKSMVLIDVLIMDQADLWRETQENCLSTEKSSLSLYLCLVGNLKSVINALTDCLGWPKFPFTAAAAAALEKSSLIDLPQIAYPRELNTLSVSSSAWDDLKMTLTFANESVSEILGRILSPSVARGIGIYAWTQRFQKVLSSLNRQALESCNYTICQLPLLIWPYVISAVRDFLKLVWLDVSNIALLYVLTAVIGCTSLEAALSFGDLRQVTSFYHCHSQHFWLRSIADSVVMAVPSFILGAIVSASLRIRADSIWRSSAVSGVIASLGSISACALTTAIASAVRTKLKALVISAVALSLLLLLSGFVLKQDLAAIRSLGYLSMFQFTFKGLVKNVYDHAADQQVGVMSNDFTLRFVGGMDPDDLLSVHAMMLVLTAQIALYRLLGWLIFSSVHKTHSALVEI